MRSAAVSAFRVRGGALVAYVAVFMAISSIRSPAAAM
jgi:hypothetical protein